MTKRNGVLLLAGLVLVACGPDENIAPGQHEQDIVNGKPVNPQELRPFSGVVLLQNISGATAEFGSGVLLTNDWVLTARHFFFDATTLDAIDPTDFEARMGGNQDGTTTIPVPGEQRSPIDKAILHPLGMSVDVALVHLTSPFQVLSEGGASNHKLQIFDGSFLGLIGQSVTCFGYGFTSLTSNPVVGQLRHDTFPLTGVNLPLALLPSEMRIDGSLIIHGQFAPGPGVAGQPSLQHNGDSGGPCFIGPNFAGTFVASNAGVAPPLPSFTEGQFVQVDAVSGWIDRILFELATSDNDGDAQPDFFASFAGINFAFRTDHVLRDPPEFGETTVQVISDLQVIDPFVPPEFTDTNTGLVWQTDPIGTGEFNGDGRPDLVFTFDTVSGGVPFRFVVAGLTNDSNSLEFQTLMAFDNSEQWEVSAVGDVDADGISDIFFRSAMFPGNNVALGVEPGIEPNTFIPGKPFFVPPFPGDEPGEVDLDWELIGTADFDHAVQSGISVADRSIVDLLWRNVATNQICFWTMGKNVDQYVMLSQECPTGIDPEEELVTVRDFNDDGRPDLIWRNTTNGELVAELSISGTGALGYEPRVPVVRLPEGTTSQPPFILDPLIKTISAH